MFENFNNQLLLLAVLCFIFANCNEQKARKRYYARNFAYSYWNDGENLNKYNKQYNRNFEIDFAGFGPQTTDTQKFCWRWVKAEDGYNYKVVTIEEGDSDLSTDGNTRTNVSFAYPYSLQNFGTSGVSIDHAFFKPILVHIHGSTFEISKPLESENNFILVGIQEIQRNGSYYITRRFLDIIPSDLVGTNNYLDQITDSTKFRSRYVVLNGIRFQVLTLEECSWLGCH